MAKKSYNITLEPKLKEEAVILFKKMGLDLSTAIGIFLSQSIREQRIPFEITLNVPNETTLRAIEEIDEMEKHPENYKTYSSAEELIEDLSSEDEDD